MLPPDSAVETTGCGPDLVLVHGTAADGGSWGVLPRLLRDRVRVTAYHRRGTARWPVDEAPQSVAEHVDDLADLIRHLGTGPVYLYGSSFGAAVVLDLCSARPGLARGAVLFEPSVAADDGAPPVAAAFLADFSRLLAAGKPEQAAERFQRRVLGEAAWRRLPAEAQQRARSLWPHIYGDLRANAAHRVRYAALQGIEVPVLLLEGGATGKAFDEPLTALAGALPRSRRRVLRSAGHQIGGPAWRELADTLAAFMGV